MQRLIRKKSTKISKQASLPSDTTSVSNTDLEQYARMKSEPRLCNNSTSNNCLSNLGSEKLLHLSVSGTFFTIAKSVLEKIPYSRLADFAASSHLERLQLCDGYDNKNSAYFYNRSAALFDVILDAYRLDEVHIPDYVCYKRFTKELLYWEIPLEKTSACCAHKLAEVLAPLKWGALIPPLAVPEGRTDFQNIKQSLWVLLENPNSSRKAQLFMFMSVLMILLTVVVLLLTSMPAFQEDMETNITLPYKGIEIADSIAVVWFSMEYGLRVFSAPSRWSYIKSVYSIIDVIAILPFYIELMLCIIGIEVMVDDLRRSLASLRILRILRVLRALRLLKVARYSVGFQSIGKALKKSWRELSMLVMTMLTVNLIFSTAMYYLELDHPDSFFPTITEASWWCIITMTTVGYGDVYPRTTAGKLLGGFVSISGIILLAFPISVIVEAFDEAYESTKAESVGEKNHQSLQLGLPTKSRAPSVNDATAALLCEHLQTALKVVESSTKQRRTTKRKRGLLFV